LEISIVSPEIPVLRWRDADSDENHTLDETLYYCNDANMNVTALVSTSGTVVERYLYSPYGQPEIYNDSWTAVAWANSKKNEILYCGYRWDPETGMYQVRNREYHPTVGRWVTRDPRLYKQGMTLYEYAMSGPLDTVDPFGLEGKVSWNETHKPVEVNKNPRRVSQAVLDKAVPANRAGERGQYRYASPEASAGSMSIFDNACCSCWFADVIVTMATYQPDEPDDPGSGLGIYIKKDLPPLELPEVTVHEETHVKDASDVFNGKKFRKPLEDEVDAHNKQETAYKLETIRKEVIGKQGKKETINGKISTRGECKAACEEYLGKMANDRLKDMKDEIHKREKVLDKK